MNEVKRYDCTDGHAAHCYGCYQMSEEELGDYVEFSDYEALRAKAGRLAEALEKMLEAYDDGVGKDWEWPILEKARAALSDYRT